MLCEQSRLMEETRHQRIARFLTRFPPYLIFLLVAGINSVLLTVLTPPFQVHDEFQHFLRSYQLSEGQIWGVQQGERVGSVLPSSLPEFIERTWGTLKLFEIPPVGEHPLTDVLTELQRPLDPQRREFVEFYGAAVYSPLPYLPQVVGISIARFFEASPIALLYAS